MSTRSERDKSKSQQERHQAILSALLKDEDNKYCVDCDAKGPRWASWNLGIFLCIRCAGIHRNLGVHISKVKSVNLDSWTPEQIAMMQEMGNSRARAVYEAELPDNYRRPQTDSGLEAFIRAKYETKKYIAKEWIPPQPKVQKSDLEDKPVSRRPIEDEPPKKEKKKSRPRPAAAVNLSAPPVKSGSGSAKTETKSPPESKPKSEPPKSAEVDLLGLDAPVAAPADSGNNDLFGDFISSNTVPAAPAATGTEAAATNNGLSDVSLFGGDSGQANQGQEKKSTKESIMALYGPGGAPPQQQQQQMFGVPGGMYMGQQPNQMGMMGNVQNGGMMGGMQPQQGGNMGMMGGMQAPGMQQQQQGGMMMGGMGMQQGMMGGQAGGMNMMGQGQQGMYNNSNMGNMYNAQQSQFQQMQNQMASMGLNQQNMGGYQQMGAVPAGGAAAGGWTNQQSGQTLSNNLWQ